MPHVINRNYSKFYDVKTRVQFEPVLDGKLGSHVAHAQTDAEFGGRPGFEALSDGEYLELISAEPERAVEGEAVSTGDPVADAAAAASGGRRDTAAPSDSRQGRRADGRKPLVSGDMIDPESPAAAHVSLDLAEGGEANGHD